MEELKFTKELKSKWLEALKSGEYKQGQGALKEISLETGETKHCCLGVLAEVCNWKIDTSTDSIKGNKSYKPFVHLLSAETCDSLILENDWDNSGTFEAVIPIIEKLETVDQ